ncbi:MAG: metallophosphatase family protein [Saprospiraceae bacterium]|nr:metallophosphatase family protein [Saprospiraceae bacterium]
MPKIGLLSDTHSRLDPTIFEYFKDCDEVWHAGDIGRLELAQQLEDFKPFRAVYGNIDGKEIKAEYPLNLNFEVDGLKVFMTHIGGYPQRYTKRVKALLSQYQPDLYICGHSHILKVMPDKSRNLLHINPGACGWEGWHKMRTVIRFDVEGSRIRNLEVIELGLRGKLPMDVNR